MSTSEGGSSRRRWLLTGLAVVAVLVILLYGAASYFVYDQVGKAPQACWPKDAANTTASFPIPAPFPQDKVAEYQMPAAQDVTFPSRDPQIPDAALAGWWIPGADPQGPAVILVHGVQSCRRESSVLLAASMLHRAGFSVLLMDLRDHGDSQGDDARFAGGSEEYMDVLGAWDWVREQGVPAGRIGIAGFSFGSISSIVAGSQEPGVAAVFADSSTTTMGEGIGLFLADQLKDGSGLSKILVPGTHRCGRGSSRTTTSRSTTRSTRSPPTQAGTSPSSTVRWTRSCRPRWRPSLHDTAAAAGAITPDAWIVPEAGHTQGIYYDPAGYEQHLVSFFTTALGAQ